MPEAKPSIHQKMAAILTGLPAIGKDSFNQGLKFNFRSIDNILNELNPLLEKHGVFVLPRVIDVRTEALQPKGRAALVTVEYRFTADDGSEVVAISAGEGHDHGDKAVSKAMTMAFKTCLGQVFAIATEDDPDGDSTQTSAVPGGGRSDTGGSAAAAPATTPPPPSGDRLQERRVACISMAQKLIAEGTADHAARREQLLAAMAAAGLPNDFGSFDELQCDAFGAIINNLSGPF